MQHAVHRCTGPVMAFGMFRMLCAPFHVLSWTLSSWPRHQVKTLSYPRLITLACLPSGGIVLARPPFLGCCANLNIIALHCHTHSWTLRLLVSCLIIAPSLLDVHSSGVRRNVTLYRCSSHKKAAHYKKAVC